MFDYDYLAVADSNEVLVAYKQVMSKESTDQAMKVKMAEIGLVHYTQLEKAARKMCDQNPDIKDLVNQQIEENRISEASFRKSLIIPEEKISLIKKPLE